MTPIQKAARAVCARSLTGFCSLRGDELGCKSGRGAELHWTQCKATDEQLKAADEWAIAECVLSPVMEGVV
jgi:hypothetical protein